MVLDEIDIVGIVDDLGVTARLENGAEFRGVLRRDYQSEDMADARVEGVLSTLMVSAETMKDLNVRKQVTLSIEGDLYTVRRVEPDVSGFARIVLIAK